MSKKRGTVPYPKYDGTQVCAQIDPEIFFPEPNVQGLSAPKIVKAFCNTCPFKVDCLAYALSNNVIGIWGGTTNIERKRIRSRYTIPLENIYE